MNRNTLPSQIHKESDQATKRNTQKYIAYYWTYFLSMDRNIYRSITGVGLRHACCRNAPRMFQVRPTAVPMYFPQNPENLRKVAAGPLGYTLNKVFKYVQIVHQERIAKTLRNQKCHTPCLSKGVFLDRWVIPSWFSSFLAGF